MIIPTGRIITMIENMALLRLMTWLSPAFPVGAFSYSHGIEQAIQLGLIHNRQSLEDWLVDILHEGSGWNDAVLFAESHRIARAKADFSNVADLAEALAGSRERHMETMLQGEAFLSAAQAWPNPVFDRLPVQIASPVAVGAIAGAHGIELEAALCAFLHAFISNLVQGAVRLVPLGQRDGVSILASMEADIRSCSERAAEASLDELGSCAIISDIMAMRHETQYSRVFRS
ncbi:urease accessory protein UreF [Phyllobacterium sp. SB3]|uniref:urease accessory protein UreF n=1 Tax=Phyllobacterium sp. SB3 TaxID=3156073 RepID=UPI0032AF86C2